MWHLRKGGDGKHCVQFTVQRHGQTKVLRPDYSTIVKLPLPPKITTTLLKAYSQMFLLSSVSYPVNTQKQKENILKGKQSDRSLHKLVRFTYGSLTRFSQKVSEKTPLRLQAGNEEEELF